MDAKAGLAGVAPARAVHVEAQRERGERRRHGSATTVGGGGS